MTSAGQPMFRNVRFSRLTYLFLYFPVHWPKHVDFDQPESEGLLGARNFYISTDLKVEVGVWHVLPQDLIEESEKQTEKKEWFEASLSRGQPIGMSNF